MPYRARSLTGAARRVRQLEKQVAYLSREKATLRRQVELMAMLAAEGPAFDNPLLIFEAMKFRDRVLAERCGLAPDGKRLPQPTTTEGQNP